MQSAKEEADKNCGIRLKRIKLPPSPRLRWTSRRARIKMVEILMTKTKLLKWPMPYGDIEYPHNRANLRV
jgi:hypothetical protein